MLYTEIKDNIINYINSIKKNLPKQDVNED